MPREGNANQHLADMLTNIQAARSRIGSLSLEQFSENIEKVDSVQLRLQIASEAARRLNKQWPEVMKDIEKRYPEISWGDLRGFSSVSRHDYDIIDAERIWEDLQPEGDIVRTEEALRRELGLA